MGSQKGAVLATQNEPKFGLLPIVYLHAGLEIGSGIPYVINREATKTPMHFALKDLNATGRGDDPKWVHKCQNGKIAHTHFGLAP